MRVGKEALAAVERLAAAELRSVKAQIETLLRETRGCRGIGFKPPRSNEEL